jgi:chromosome segregation ATPase
MDDETNTRTNTLLQQIIGQLNVLASDVKDLKSTYNVLTSDVKDLKSTYNVLTSDVKDLKWDVKDLKWDVKDLKSEVKDLKSEVQELKTDSIATNFKLDDIYSTLNPLSRIELQKTILADDSEDAFTTEKNGVYTWFKYSDNEPPVLIGCVHCASALRYRATLYQEDPCRGPYF